jgi:predicted phage terminase large subunit-like protein
MRKISNKKMLQSVLRTDLPAFIAKCFGTVTPGIVYLPNWHMRAIAHQLERVRRGEIKRLLITMPPRSGKSVSASVAFPAFILGHDPSRRIVCVSYAEELAQKLARDCRAVMESPWYRELFPGTRLSRTKSAELDFETTARGGRLSTSTGGALTGRGGSLIVIDDPQKPADAMSEARRATTLDWFRNTLSSRLDDKRSDAIVVVMQRLHVDDLAAHLIETGEWEHLDLQAIASEPMSIPIGNGQLYEREYDEVLHDEREPREVLDELKANMGTFHFNAQYQQRPVPEEGNLVDLNWFPRYDVPPGPEDRGRIVQSWDMAVRDGEQNDFCVGITAHVFRKEIHILDVFRKKLDYPGQRKVLIKRARQFGAKVILIEKAATGSPLVADLRNMNTPGVPTPIPFLPRGSKVERLSVQTHQIEAGDVRLPQKAEWLDEFLNEIRAFPFGRHDDQVDALSQLLAWAERENRHRRSTGVSMPIFFRIDPPRDDDFGFREGI